MNNSVQGFIRKELSQIDNPEIKEYLKPIIERISEFAYLEGQHAALDSLLSFDKAVQYAKKKDGTPRTPDAVRKALRKNGYKPVNGFYLITREIIESLDFGKPGNPHLD